MQEECRKNFKAFVEGHTEQLRQSGNYIEQLSHETGDARRPTLDHDRRITLKAELIKFRYAMNRGIGILNI